MMGFASGTDTVERAGRRGNTRVQFWPTCSALGASGASGFAAGCESMRGAGVDARVGLRVPRRAGPGKRKLLPCRGCAGAPSHNSGWLACHAGQRSQLSV